MGPPSVVATRGAVHDPGTCAGRRGAPAAPSSARKRLGLRAEVRPWADARWVTQDSDSSRRARADAKPPYVIAHDATLLEIATRRPRTETDLRRVPGMGPVKVETYGAEILAVVRASDG